MNVRAPWAGFVYLCGAFVVLYGLNTRAVLTGDTLGHVYVARSLAFSGDFDLRESEAEMRAMSGGDLPYYTVEDRGRLRSIFSFLPGVLLAPFVGAADVLAGTSLQHEGLAAKFAASLFTFGAGLFLWLLLRRRLAAPLPLIVVGCFWFASPLWALSTSYLQHQPSIFFRFAALYGLYGGSDEAPPLGPRRAFLAGVLAGLGVLARYQTLLSLLPLCLLLAWRLRSHVRSLVAFALGGAFCAAVLFLYNRVMTGDPFDIGYVTFPWAVFASPTLERAAGLFINPTSGLLIHSPWMLLFIVGFCSTARCLLARDSTVSPLAVAAFFSPWPLLLLYSCYTSWFGGWTWGYRFLLDVIPELTLLAGFGLAALPRRRWAAAFAGSLIAFGGFVGALGAFTFDTEWFARHDLGAMPHQEWLWQVRHGHLLYNLKRGGVIYLGTKRLQWKSNPYAAAGLYPTEQWGDLKVAWTRPGGTRFLFVADTIPPTLRLYAAAECAPCEAEIRVDGGALTAVQLAPGTWTTLELPGVGFQHSAIVEIVPSCIFEESPPGGRHLGVAVDLANVRE